MSQTFEHAPHRRVWIHQAEGKISQPLSTLWAGIGAKPIAIAIVIASILGFGALALVISSATAGPSPSTQSTIAETRYVSASDCINIILAQERAGQWQVAATNARTCLGRPNLNPADIATLVHKTLADGLQALNATQVKPYDYAAQQQALGQYEDIKLFARERKVTLPKTFYQIAEDGNASGRLLLARAALQDAFDQGDITSSNFAHVRFSFSTSYNLGWWLTRNTANPGYDYGLSLLVAADQLDRQYQLGVGLARLEMKQLQPDEARWPAPAKTPMLTNHSNGKEG